jgi:hypothetical protein
VIKSIKIWHKENNTFWQIPQTTKLKVYSGSTTRFLCSAVRSPPLKDSLTSTTRLRLQSMTNFKLADTRVKIKKTRPLKLRSKAIGITWVILEAQVPCFPTHLMLSQYGLQKIKSLLFVRLKINIWKSKPKLTIQKLCLRDGSKRISFYPSLTKLTSSRILL